MGITNQIEGGMIQAASWTLKEQVTFDQKGITSTNWGELSNFFGLLKFLSGSSND